MDDEGSSRRSRKRRVVLAVTAAAVVAGLLVAVLVVAPRRGITWHARYEAKIAELRGARQFTFREEALARPIRLREFRMEGLTDDDLRGLGLGEGGFYRLR